jgi:hypothetical protein
MKEIHILAGIVSLFAGFIALYTAKGAWMHRRSGTVFVYAMLVMAGLGALIALTTNPNRINVIAGSLVFYLVATGLLAVVRTIEQQRRLLVALTVLATAITLSAWRYGFMASDLPGGELDHIPAGPIYMFAVVGLLGVVGDLRLLWRGRIDATQRLTRHLWRLCYALWVATTSAFFGQAKFLPHWFRDAHLNAVPIFLVLFTLLYWLVRVRVLKKLPRPELHRNPASRSPPGRAVADSAKS